MLIAIVLWTVCTFYFLIDSRFSLIDDNACNVSVDVSVRLDENENASQDQYLGDILLIPASGSYC